MLNVALNGFGKISRTFLRMIPDDMRLVAINDVQGTAKQHAHLLRYGTVLENYPGPISTRDHEADKSMCIGFMNFEGNGIHVYKQPDHEALPWKKLKVDVVIDATGLYMGNPGAEKHLKAGAKKAVISEPSEYCDTTLCSGINLKSYDSEDHHVISAGSCTTNCLAPIAKVLDERLGIEQGWLTTVHSYTNDQNLVDSIHKDPRRMRPAANNIIPASTGAARAISKVLPDLEGKLDGMAYRVPVDNVSVVDLAVVLGRDGERAAISAEELNTMLAESGQPHLQYTAEELVSSDYTGKPVSCMVDGSLTKAVGGGLYHISAWYDNETGFTARMIEVARHVGGE